MILILLARPGEITKADPQPKADSPLVAAVPIAVATSSRADYPVEKVIDGDTLVVTLHGTSTTIRLIGLDTPETVDPRKPVQCFGKTASERAKSLLAGTRVSLEFDPSQGQYDKYGRTLAYAYLADGTLFNKYMIAEGYGHEYTYNVPYKFQREFKAAEVSARSERKGLWADDACAAESARTPKPAPALAPVDFTPTKQYDCTRNAYNCSSFASQKEAQYVFELCGGSAGDVHKLDNDRDGRVCEALP